MKKIAVVNDISTFGRCSLTAALPIISAFGVQCCPVVTGVFSHQTGYPSYQSVDMTPYLPAFIDEWKKQGARFDAILTGFLASAEQGKEVERFIEEFKSGALVVVDPVMADDGTVYDGFDAARIEAVKRLVQKADIITPNLHELCLLTENAYRPDYDNEKLSEMAAQTGVPTVIVTGIKRAGKIATVSFTDGQLSDTQETQQLGHAFSGTGDMFAACVTAALVQNQDVESAVKGAVAFISNAIAATPVGEGDTPYCAAGTHYERCLQVFFEK